MPACMPARSGGQTLEPLPISTTGNPMFDMQLNNIWRSLASIFDLRADMKLYEEEDDPNAIAFASSINAFLPDGTVYLGVGLVTQDLERYFSGPRRPYTYTVAAIAAHEMGHLAQFKYLRESARDSLSPLQLELGADFLAGWAFRMQNVISIAGSLGAVSDGVRILYELGDDTEFSAASHGDPDQRVDAFRAGLATGARSGRQATRLMVQYLVDNTDDTDDSTSASGGSRGER
jgi:hypothetical protein